jgi:hypothetical protein
VRVSELDGMHGELTERRAAKTEEWHGRGLGAVFETDIEIAFAAVIACPGPGPGADCGSTQAISRAPGIQHSRVDETAGGVARSDDFLDTLEGHKHGDTTSCTRPIAVAGSS